MILHLIMARRVPQLEDTRSLTRAHAHVVAVITRTPHASTAIWVTTSAQTADSHDPSLIYESWTSIRRALIDCASRWPLRPSNTKSLSLYQVSIIYITLWQQSQQLTPYALIGMK